MKELYPVLTLEEARSYESTVLAGDSSVEVAMEAAGLAIGAAIDKDFCELRPWSTAPRVAILAGKGHNTGDALIAARALFSAHPGMLLQVVTTEEPSALAGPVRAALEDLNAAMAVQLSIVSPETFIAEQESLDIVIDALYGLGFKPPLRAPIAKLLQAVNARKDIGMRVAIDMPSGLSEQRDSDAFVADFTYIPGVAKEPCFREDSGSCVGRIRFLELDVFRAQKPLDAPRLNIASPLAFRRLNRLRASRSDKRHHGHCIILAGSTYFPGAALMTTQAALKSGAGLVTTFSPGNVAPYLASVVPEAMWRPIPLLPDGGFDVEVVRMVSSVAAKAHAMVIGPGLMLDRATVFSICRIIREIPLPLVLDASALTQDIVSTVLARPAGSGPVVITPHAGEFGRMHGLRDERADVPSLLRFSARHRAVTILKGSPSIVTDGDRVAVVPAGGPVLARGGSGDILSGILVSLLSRESSDPMATAIEAITWHGAAGDSLARQSGAIAVRTTELIDHLSTTLRASD